MGLLTKQESAKLKLALFISGIIIFKLLGGIGLDSSQRYVRNFALQESASLNLALF